MDSDYDLEGSNPKIQIDSGSSESENGTATSYKGEYLREGSRSPYSNQEQSDSLDSEYFPLAKKPTREVDKKRRRYRGMTVESSQEQHYSRHNSDRERKIRHTRSSHPPSSSEHFRRNAPQPPGRRSPHAYEGGRRSPHTYEGGRRSPHAYEGGRRSPHTYEGGRRSPHAYEGGRRSPHAYEGGRHSPHTYEGGRRSPHGYEGGRRSPHAYEGGRRSPHAYEGGHRSPHAYEGGREEYKRDDHTRHPRDREVYDVRNSADRGDLYTSRSRSPITKLQRKEVLRKERAAVSADEGRSRRDHWKRIERRRSPLDVGQIESPIEDSEDDTSESSHERVNIQHGGNIDRIIKDLEGSSSSESSEGSASDQEKQNVPANEQDRVHPLHVMRSKFDSDEDMSGEDGGDDVPPPPPPPPLPPPSTTLISGYEESFSGEESTNEKEEDINKEEEAAKNQELSTLFSEELDKEFDEVVEKEEDMSGLPCYLPALMGCRNVEGFEWLNRIEEGTYGVVHRAKDRKTGEIVALKKLKMEKEREGFPITSLREINMLLKAKHPNVVHVKEIVVGSNMDKIFIVMEYVEHDLKALMETMQKPFLQGEVKTLMIQLLRAVHHLHDNWILHRDLKASNLLLSHKGILKVGDFGLAREYGSPLKNYTPVVVTLWYRAPELLLGAKQYSTAVDMWSAGCIFAEFLQKEPLFRGRSEIDQINLIFKELGTPNKRIWPGYEKLPTTEKVTFTNYPYNNLRKRFPVSFLSDQGFELLNKMLTYNPDIRISAYDALQHRYFKEPPMAIPPSMFPTWPAKSEMTRTKKREKSPKPPEGGANQPSEEKGAPGFSLKFQI